MPEAKTTGADVPGRRFKPYPAYKDSGVEWLGEIPAHWTCVALSRVSLSRCDGPFGSGLKSEHYASEGVRVIRLQNIGEAAFVDKDRAYVDHKYAQQLGDHSVVAGDVLVAGLGDEGHPVGRACIAPEGIEPAMVKADCFRFRLRRDRVLADFAAHHLSSTAAAASALATGATRSRMNLGTTASRKIALPPIDEQRAIAAFLDREAARIDALVAKKERLIELLQEKRTALITRAVTKGLDANIAMKDSGVEWLGEIPAHWEVMKATWLFSIGSGTTPRSEDPAYYGGDVPWITTSELRESVVVSTEKTVTEEALRDFPSLKVHPKRSVAVAMYGATIGRLGILGVAATVNQACCVFSKPRDIDTWFWFYWLQMRRSHLISLGYGGGQPNLSQELLRSIRVPTPPLLEQRAITALLDRETARIDALVAKVRDAINRLKELRTALISAAVTGKIDVRGHAA